MLPFHLQQLLHPSFIKNSSLIGLRAFIKFLIKELHASLNEYFLINNRDALNFLMFISYTLYLDSKHVPGD